MPRSTQLLLPGVATLPPGPAKAKAQFLRVFWPIEDWIVPWPCARPHSYLAALNRDEVRNV
jgi:hypothetical protein